MNKDMVKEIMYVLIAIALGIIAVKFVIWLLPIILIAACSYYIYKSIKKNHNNSGSSSNQNKQKTKKKNIKIIDMEEDKK